MTVVTTGSVLISYDVKFNHNDVKEELQNLGYVDYWIDEFGKKYELPNTTLIKDGISITYAKREVKRICRELNADLNKLVCVRFRSISGI